MKADLCDCEAVHVPTKEEDFSFALGILCILLHLKMRIFFFSSPPCTISILRQAACYSLLKDTPVELRREVPWGG